MAWSSAQLSAGEIASYTSDKPLVCASHALADAETVFGRWVDGVGGTIVTDPMHPVSFAHDGYAHGGMHTRSEAAQTTTYLYFRILDLIEFDSIVLHMSIPNLFTTVSVEIDDSDSWPSPTEVSSFPTAPAPGVRFSDFSLTHTPLAGPRRYSDVEYLRVKFVQPAATNIASIREVWLSNRLQLDWHPDYPWGERASSMAGNSAVTRSGTTLQFPQGRGEASRIVSFDDESSSTLMEDWWSQSKGGTRPFYWVESPISSPKPYLMRFVGKEFVPSKWAPLTRRFQMAMTEQAPYLAQE